LLSSTSTREPIFEVTGLPQNVESARREIENHIYQRTGNMPITDSNASIANFDLQAAALAAQQASTMGNRPNYGALAITASSNAMTDSMTNFDQQLHLPHHHMNNNNYAPVSGLNNGFAAVHHHTSSHFSCAQMLSSLTLGSGLSSANSDSTSQDEGLGESPTNSFGKLSGMDPYNLMSIWSTDACDSSASAPSSQTSRDQQEFMKQSSNTSLEAQPQMATA